MSVQKVVSNYYTDLLDFLNSKYRKHNGDFEVYFNSINLDGKKKLLNKIASVYQRISILKDSQESFFRVKYKNYIAYIIMFSIMIVITAIVLYKLAKHDILEGEVYTDYDFRVTILTYIILFLVFFTIFLLIILNIRENMRRVRELMDETNIDFEKMKKLIPLQASDVLIFEFIGFKYTESRSKYNKLLNEKYDLLSPYILKGNINNQEQQQNSITGKKKAKNLANNSDTFNYDKYFNDKKADTQLLEAIKLFYDNGNGYNTLRKEIISSSNFLIMKEFRNIMKFYYKIVQRKENAAILTDESKIHDSLNKYVVKDLIIARKIAKPFNQNSYVDPSEKLTSQLPISMEISTNKSTPDFNDQYENLLMFYVYIIIYMYQVKIKKKSNDVTFDAGVKSLMPHNINLGVSEKPEFDTIVKNDFSIHFNKYLDEAIARAQQAKSQADLDIIYKETIYQFKSTIDGLYQFTMISIQGDYYFPFDKTYMKNEISSTLNKFLNGRAFDQELAQKIIEKISTSLIDDCYKTFKVNSDIDSKKMGIITRIAANIYKFNIKVSDYTQYIIGKVNEEEAIDGDLKTMLTEMLSTIDREVTQKKMTMDISSGIKNSNDERFLELDQFIQELDKLSYSDLKVGLNYDFYGDILDTFYFAVNNSIYARGGTGSKGSKDIYFNSEKNFLLGKVALWFTITILIFVQIYHMLWSFNDEKYYDKAKAIELHPNAIKDMKKNNVKIIKEGYMDEYVNIWMKRLIPLAANVFFICLLISIYKKSKAKFNFNKETIDGNTAHLRSSLNDMRILFDDLDEIIPRGQNGQRIDSLTQIGLDEKTVLYNHIKTIIDKFEKCNYVLSSAKDQIPFPYTEVIVDGFMLFLISIAVFLIVGKINPWKRIKDIHVLNKLKEKGEYMDSDEGYAADLITRASCHDGDIDSIMFTLKILFFMFVVMFLIFYSTKVISSTSEFEWGIYNSVYFEESICLD